MAGQPSKGTRVIALVGPAGAGKTSLAEAMLFAAGATDRLGSTANGSSIGDSSPESRQRGGSTELNLYNFQYLGDEFAILDVPGSVGFSADFGSVTISACRTPRRVRSYATSSVEPGPNFIGVISIVKTVSLGISRQPIKYSSPCLLSRALCQHQLVEQGVMPR